MRGLEFARIAAQAELLRLRRAARRHIVRAILGVVAVLFLLASMTALHVAAYFAFLSELAPVYAALCVAGLDVLVALIVGLLAARNTPDRIERDALLVRQSAQQHLLEAATMMAVVGPILRALGARNAYGLALAALTARYLTGRR